jgi:uncharacterized protein (TIGR03437 family)
MQPKSPVIANCSALVFVPALIFASEQGSAPAHSAAGSVRTHYKTVTLTQATRSTDAVGKEGVYSSPTQTNVQTADDAAARPIQVQLQSYSPAVLLWQSKYAVAQHADASLVGPPGLFPNVATTPVLPGETIALYGTGFGPSVTARVGGLDAPVTFAGPSAGFAGLHQVNITVPDVAPDGDLPVVLTTGGVATPAALVTVQRGP